MTPQDIEAILSGSTAMRFSVLGPHQTENGWEVRAFLPQAMDAAVVAGRRLASHAQDCAPRAFSSRRLEHEPGHYLLRLTLWNGAQG